MDKSPKDKMADDIENRLDNFFDEDEGGSPPVSDSAQLEKLKTLVLSIDWEITDSCLIELIGETDSLMPRFKADRLAQALLRMLNSLARYIQKRKARAHPDSIKRIMSVYSSLEKVCDPKETDTKEKEQAIAKEIAAFKKLKQQVEGKPKKAVPAHANAAVSAEAAANSQSQLKETVQEIERRLNSEVQKLKEQLSNLQKEFDRFRKA